MSLFGAELVTRTKFIVPSPKRTFLARARLQTLLARVVEQPLTEVVAGTGYGKSSLLAAYLQTSGTPALWYELAERDADPQVFAVHLAHLCHRAFPGVAERALALLAQPGGAARHGSAAIAALADELLDRLEAPTWLVLDDFHWLHGSEGALELVNTLIDLAPPRLHVVLAARQRPELPDLARWRLQGDVLTLDQGALAFRADELAELFASVYGLTLDAAAIARWMQETEGWPMALQLVARRLVEQGEASAPSGSLQDLFEYLAREVLERLTPDEREFLLATAPLVRLDPAVCAELAPGLDAAGMLRALNERGLFLIPLGNGDFRHHHLFREFLLERLAEAGRLIPARRAAAQALLARHEAEEAIEQFMAAGDHELAASAMAVVAPLLVSQGRYARLGTWLSRLPGELLERAPALSVCQGDACRLASRFDEALAWYDRAERAYGEAGEGRSRALAGKALVYLDTVQPAKAEQLLASAFEATEDAQRRAELLVMRAENKLNQGETAAALRLFEAARAELPEIAENEGRLRLRTGRLAEARAILRGALTPSEAEPSALTKSHRDPALVLSMVESLMGEPEAARELAEQGLSRARQQAAAWTESVGLSRVGHAAIAAGDASAAESAYREALAVAAAVGVARLKAEPLMGLGLLAGRRRELAEAEALVTEALAVTQETGDAWLCALLSVALGAVYADAGDPRAERWLLQAQTAYERGDDPYGQALVALWSARLAMALNEPKALAARWRILAELCRRHAYGYLLTRPTLLGFASAEAAGAFLLQARAQGVPAALLSPWLAELGLAEPEGPPREDVLRIRVLGTFRVWRGQEELGERAWGREKARQLFHLLVAFRGQFLPKSRIIDLLWPDLEPESADGTFRVALNALNKALEPDRASGSPARFVVRQGAHYGLAAGKDVWLDAGEFERALDAAEAFEAAGEDPVEPYRQALELSEGAFLASYDQYEGWCERERERLADRYAEAAVRLARLLAERGDDAGCLEWAQRLLERDRTAEEAYRLLMISHYRQGDRALAIKAYDRCVVALSDELDVDPMPETQALFERITNLEPVTLSS